MRRGFGLEIAFFRAVASTACRFHAEIVGQDGNSPAAESCRMGTAISGVMSRSAWKSETAAGLKARPR